MQHRETRAIFLVAVMCIVTIGVFVVFQVAMNGSGDTVTPTNVTQSTAAETPSPTQKSPSASTSMREEIEARNPQGPWSRNLSIATSTNGTTFATATTFVERAGVPSVIRDANGRLIAAFQWFPENDTAWDKVAVAYSDDDGATWSEPQSITVNGMPEGYQRPFDPTVTFAEDGRIRMFFTSSIRPPGIDGTTEIYSAISDDGVTYTFEDGVRLGVAGERVIDSAAMRFNGTWHLTSPRDGIGAYHATSPDGITFTQQHDIASPAWNWLGNLVDGSNGTMRFYGSGPGGIWWSETADGDTWSVPTRTNVNGADPAVVRLEHGTFIIISVVPR